MAVAVALAQIGEFSFILASLGKQLGVLPTRSPTNTLSRPRLFPSRSIQLLYRTRRSDGQMVDAHHELPAGFRRRPTAQNRPCKSPDPENARSRRLVTGPWLWAMDQWVEAVSRLLQDNDVEPTMIELNWRSCVAERVGDQPYGDATHRETLKAAGVAGADVYPECRGLARTKK